MDELIEKYKKETDIFNKARIIKYLIKDKGLKVKDISEKIEVSSSYICHLERILKLPEVVIDGYYSKLITISHLFLLSRIDDENKLINIYEKILVNNLTLAQIEDLIREELYQIKNKGDFLTKDEKENLRKKFKDNIKNATLGIVQTRTRGKILIEIKDNLEKTSKLIKKLISAMIEVKD
ncbi:MAG: hypothetical protein Fur009_4730 [Candidatus Microgenomates bacterium]